MIFSEANRKLEIFYKSNDKSIEWMGMWSHFNFMKKSSIIPFWLQILNSWATEQLQIISTKNQSHT